MATNLEYPDELRSILISVARKQFNNSRQLNPHSNLFLSVKRAIKDGLISGAKLDESFSTSLAEMNLTNAKLTDSGQRKLQQLMKNKQ